VLLDEFEKAHANVHDRFLQFIDEGVFINGAGETVSCRSMVVIATSNAGAELYRTAPMGFDVHDDGLAHEARRKLLQHFRFELLNRFDEVVLFEPLSRSAVREIAAREIEALANRSGLRSRGIALRADPCLLDWLVEEGYDERFGARFLRRAIERHLATAVAEVIVSGGAREGDTIRAFVDDGRMHACRDVVPPLV
jgi:ATP-dependent Clp protease ATP-binding subunit ClpA